MRLSLLLLLAVIAACAPRQEAATPVILVPGGKVVGAWVELAGDAYPLPGPPLFADAAGDLLYLAYPYELVTMRGGEVEKTYPLPGYPRFLHARPEPVVGTERGVYLPEEDLLLSYPARDARRRAGELFWTDGDAWREGERLRRGDFRQVSASERGVAFTDDLAYFPHGGEFPLPSHKKAELGRYLYLLTEEGVLALDEAGSVVAEKRGRFLDLVAEEERVWLLGEDGEVIALGAWLEAL